MSSPAPISWQPSGQWIGDDGLWSSFALRTGTPPRLSYVLPSSASTSTWVVAPLGCEPSPYTADDCPVKRGGVVNVTDSSTWHEEGVYGLVLETNINAHYDSASAEFGLDTVSLGASNTTGNVTLEAQVVGGMGENIFYTGFFGLNDQPSNFSTLSDSHPSFLSNLKARNLIPSLSWSYTAGAYYRNKLGSLTFGGYDTSQFEPNDISFSLAPDTSRDLVVGLKAISTTSSNGSAIPLLSTPVLTFIDSTIPMLYLPLETCNAFQSTFNLQWDPESGLYLIDPQTHNNMTALNPNVTLTIGDSKGSGPTVDIVMPYSSFNLTASFPFTPVGLETAQFFPLRPAHNESQYALGRAFLQDAYLITNYEQSNFSVSQVRHSGINQASIVPIAAPAATGKPPINPTVASAPVQTHSSHSGLSQTALAGIITGTIAAVLLALIGLGLLLWRRRAQTKKGRTSSVEKSQIQYVFDGKQELDGTAFTQPRSWYDREFKEKRAELTNAEVVELPDQPITHEIMSRPYKPWGARRKRKSHNRKYNAYIDIKKARDNRMSNGKISPPISKYCRVSCAPIRGKFIDLNRTLPPTPIYQSPRNSWARTPMPRNRRARFPKEHKLPR